VFIFGRFRGKKINEKKEKKKKIRSRSLSLALCRLLKEFAVLILVVLVCVYNI
jgi:hypothetical protein